MPKTTKLGTAQIRELAVKARVDPRTIRRVLAGERTRTGTGQRARNALVAAGYKIPKAS